jgi:lipopolysaccharide export system permease protein
VGLYEIKYFINPSKKNKIKNCDMQNISNIFKEMYKRTIIPFYVPILTIIPFALILTAKENSNYFRFKIFTFLTGLAIVIFSETTIRFITKNFSTNFIILIIPLFIFILIYFLFLYNFRFSIKGRS